MSAAHYAVARLSPGFDLESFDCGAPAYNEWLVRHAALSVQAGICAVYLLVETHNGGTRVVGYYAISPTLVVRESIPRTIARGWPNSVPAWKLGTLAVHVDLRADMHSEWGRQLLRHALETIIGVAEAGGGKVIVADADNAGLMRFYIRNGFTPTGIEGDLSLYLKVSTAARHSSARSAQSPTSAASPGLTENPSRSGIRPQSDVSGDQNVRVDNGPDGVRRHTRARQAAS